MALEQQLTDTLTQAIKAKDARTADVVRMIKTKIQERRTAKGSSGQVDDALVLDVIGAYRKQRQKAAAEFDQVGGVRGGGGARGGGAGGCPPRGGGERRPRHQARRGGGVAGVGGGGPCRAR